MKILTSQQIKSVENLALANKVSEDVLMKNAGEAAATFIEKKTEFKGKSCVVLCGLGNNGGDGYVLAKKLYNDYVNVIVVSLDGNLKASNLIKLKKDSENLGIKILNTTNIDAVTQAINQADILVDALCGTGFHGELSDEIAALNILWQNSSAVKFALDLPTGIVADTGEVCKSCFSSDFTISFICLKPAHVFSSSRVHCGKIALSEIGISKDIINQVNSDYELLDENLVWESIQIRSPFTNKGDYGKLLNISGSQQMRGAAALSTLGSLRSGVGIVTLATVKGVIGSLSPVLLESKFLRLTENSHGTISSCELSHILTQLSQFDVCLIGCGLGVNNETQKIVTQIVEKSEIPLVLDADALTIISQNVNVLKNKKATVILTPHMCEMARLLNISVQDLIKKRKEVITEFAQQYNVTVVLKDCDTLIVDSTGKTYVNIGGNPGLAKGGSGDVLAGIIAGLMAQKLENAPACGVFLHSKAAQMSSKRKSQYAMLPSDILEDLCKVFLDAGR